MAATRLTFPLDGRMASFRVLDVYYDYSNERGYIIMDRGTLLKYLPDPAPSNVAVYLKPGVPLDQGRRAVEAAIAGRKVLVFSNRTLREEAIQIFDRTFAITYALEAVAVFVAVMGVAGALLALVIDRRREFGLLRFLGARAGQMRRMILFEAGLLGLLANIAGLISGYSAFAAADLRDQQAVVRMDHSVSLAGGGAAWARYRWSMWRRCWRVFIRPASRRG